MTRLHRSAALLAAVGLATLGCAGLTPTPVPKDKMDYVGTWEDKEVVLTIEASGMVDYEKNSGAGTTSINAPITQWHDGGFDVGIGPMVTTFSVSKPPHEVRGEWKMTVDDHELTRR